MLFQSSEEAMLEKLDAAADRVRRLMVRSDQASIAELWSQLDISNIYHDCALEGEVVSPDELDGALNRHAVTDASSLNLYQGLRRHREILERARELAASSKLDFDLDLFKSFHLDFLGDGADAKVSGYRREIPLHRTYFHEISDPSRIAQSMRKVVAWLNDPAEVCELHPVQRAAKFHLRFMKVFPFTGTSGKVARTVTNIMLVRYGYLPAIIHATERQRYYESLRHTGEELTVLILDSAMASLDAAEKFLRRSAMAS